VTSSNSLIVKRRYFYLAILAIAGFVTSFGAHIVATNLPSYAETVGVGALMIGLLIAVYDFAELFAKPLAGAIADRRGMKMTLLAGIVIFIAGSLLYLVLPPTLLLLVRFVQGVGAAALSTVSISLVAKYFETGRGQAFGIYNAIKGAGYVLSPALGGFLAGSLGFASIFIVSAGVGAVALLLAFLLPGSATGEELDDDDDDLSFKEFGAILTDRRMLPIYAVIVINMFIVGVLFGFLPVYLHGLGYTPIESGTIVSATTISYLGIQPLAGRLADRVNIRTTVIVGLILAAAAIVVITFTSGALLVAVAIVAGIGVGTVWTNTDALVSAMSNPERMATSMGAAQSFKELGDMIGPLMVGAITQWWGVRAGFVACGAVAVLLLALLTLSGRSPGVPVATPGRGG
jgi:MFS transporter, ACDE family, multidrug resistance protein